DERPARERASWLGGLEQERAGATARQLPIDADRGLGVGEQGARDRHQPVRIGQLAELGAADHHACAASAPASKQERSPVWQATPTWSTLTSTASPSQSRATAFTNWTWPDVPPFTQRCCRDRDQYVARPVVSVRWSASSSIQPTMSTSSVSYCWITATMSPLASRLSRSATPGSSMRQLCLVTYPARHHPGAAEL